MRKITIGAVPLALAIILVAAAPVLAIGKNPSPGKGHTPIVVCHNLVHNPHIIVVDDDSTKLKAHLAHRTQPQLMDLVEGRDGTAQEIRALCKKKQPTTPPTKTTSSTTSSSSTTEPPKTTTSTTVPPSTTSTSTSSPPKSSSSTTSSADPVKPKPVKTTAVSTVTTATSKTKVPATPAPSELAYTGTQAWLLGGIGGLAILLALMIYLLRHKLPAPAQSDAKKYRAKH